MKLGGGLIEWLHDYGAILFGLAVGAVAHIGRKLTERETLSFREVVGFVMQLGVIGLVASVSTKAMNITDTDMRALVTAILAISAQEVMTYLKRNGWVGPVKSTIPPKD